MQGQVIVEVNVVPLGTATTSISRYIAPCLSAAASTALRATSNASRT